MKQLIEFQKKCPTIPFDKEANLGKGFKYKYASYPGIVKVVQPILAELDMGFFHFIHEGFLTCTIFYNGKDGADDLQSTIKLPDHSDPKALGAAITYYKRYTLSGLLGIVTDEDTDVQGIEKTKPKLSAKAFESAQLRITKGEQGIMTQCKANFELTPKQEDVLLNLELEWL